MAKTIASYSTPGGGTVTLHAGGLLAGIAGNGRFYRCTGCGPGLFKVTNWSNEAQADLVDYDATERDAAQHARTCHRNPK
ncbi:hypothetical protein ACIHCX_03330 [Streptomyces sp. NPDC052043]|uniref:hypothetical protein n=1 Tax=Streptomyces sp. NPDC052043 TaxID=3365684 RepID=UPI0037CF637E